MVKILTPNVDNNSCPLPGQYNIHNYLRFYFFIISHIFYSIVFFFLTFYLLKTAVQAVECLSIFNLSAQDQIFTN